jgi:hypothetical protein
MLSLETPSGRGALLASILLMVIGGLLLLVSLVAVAGLLVQERFTWERANAALIVLLVSAIVTGGGIALYRRINRNSARVRPDRKRLS